MDRLQTLRGTALFTPTNSTQSYSGIQRLGWDTRTEVLGVLWSGGWAGDPLAVENRNNEI